MYACWNEKYKDLDQVQVFIGNWESSGKIGHFLLSGVDGFDRWVYYAEEISQ